MFTSSQTVEQGATQLPSPDDRPDADVVIFDGHCRMCQAQMRALNWWDCQGHLAYLSLHDERVGQRYPDLTHEMLMNRMYVIDQKGRRHSGAEAVRYLTRRLRRLWWAAPLLHIPGSLRFWQFVYDQIARRRYWFNAKDCCDDGSCRLHRR